MQFFLTYLFIYPFVTLLQNLLCWIGRQADDDVGSYSFICWSFHVVLSLHDLAYFAIEIVGGDF